MSPELAPTFRALLGLSADIKPFECVGDVDECRVAVLLAAARPDRAEAETLRRLAGEVRRVAPALRDLDGPDHPAAAAQLRPSGPHAIPERYAPGTLVG